MKNLFLIITLFTYKSSLGQENLFVSGIQFKLIAPSEKQLNLLNINGNPAVNFGKSAKGGGFFFEQPFLLKELINFNAVLVYEDNNQNLFSFTFQHFGFKVYSKETLALGYSRKLGSMISIGSRFSYRNENFQWISNHSNISGDIGMIIKLSNQMNYGISLGNIISHELKNQNALGKIVFKSGLGYELSPQFYVTADFIREENFKNEIIISTCYSPHKKLKFNYGLITSNMSNYAGIEMEMFKMKIGLSIFYHSTLSITPGFYLTTMK
jgi:hypothetical protein